MMKVNGRTDGVKRLDAETMMTNKNPSHLPVKAAMKDEM